MSDCTLGRCLYLPQDSALPLVEALMPCVSRLLEKGRFPGVQGGNSPAGPCGCLGRLLRCLVSPSSQPAAVCRVLLLLHLCLLSPHPQPPTPHPCLPPTAEERRVAICVMDDVLEHTEAGGAKYAPSVLPLLLTGCADRDSNVRQCSVYGLGCAAQHR